jgi:hypothetical protein
MSGQLSANFAEVTLADTLQANLGRHQSPKRLLFERNGMTTRLGLRRDAVPSANELAANSARE